MVKYDTGKAMKQRNNSLMPLGGLKVTTHQAQSLNAQSRPSYSISVALLAPSSSSPWSSGQCVIRVVSVGCDFVLYITHYIPGQCVVQLMRWWRQAHQFSKSTFVFRVASHRVVPWHRLYIQSRQFTHIVLSHLIQASMQ
jgi:hypothetical protein